MEKDQKAATVLLKAQKHPPLPVDAPIKPLDDFLKAKVDKPLDPHIEAINACWEKFEGLDYEGQIALFTQTLDESVLMDEEMAFEMLSTLYEQSTERGDLNRFETLLDALRERLPEAYNHDASYYLQWRISHALAAGRTEILPALANALSETAGRDIDSFCNAADQLAYHGQLSPLADALSIAWPRVKKSDDVIFWAIDKFAELAGTYAVFDALEQGIAQGDIEAELKKRIEVYHAVDAEALARYIKYLTGNAEKSWTSDEFDFLTRHAAVSDHDAENVYLLSVEFLGYLHREEGMPFSKGELGRQQLQHYLMERHAGKLKSSDNSMPSARHKDKAKPKRAASLADHGLYPDCKTLERYLIGHLNFINPQYYKAAVLMELIPAWFRFLESRRLIDQPPKELLHCLQGLAEQLLKVYGMNRVDPTLSENLKNVSIELSK